ncbi:hypothetical protein TRFO_30048 [Tritrichomonas foetus]|uniref:Protein kinase domain-containing protein n=1 Tax=Tritrichomonas foetus TaxID=1144522 RepID=A0A1J4JYY1_9EUKA|nr:hypothetical protein TRFO_30048 [Tritrichomonas foetus]|eukprot:OHT02740.1 hypothetical protein TRFO_30048 [Tritrichomonas foetus]
MLCMISSILPDNLISNSIIVLHFFTFKESCYICCIFENYCIITSNIDLILLAIMNHQNVFVLEQNDLNKYPEGKISDKNRYHEKIKAYLLETNTYCCNENFDINCLSNFIFCIFDSVLLFFVLRHFEKASNIYTRSFFHANPNILPKLFKLDDFIVLGTIGSGGSSKIDLALHKGSGRFFVLKCFFERKKFKKEINVLKLIKHDNIIHYYGNVKKSTVFHYTAVLAFCNQGNLRNFNKKHDLSPTEKTRIVLQILVAIDHIHALGIIHRDIKVDNILIDENFNAILTDFDTAKEYKCNSKATLNVGTFSYMSPEQLSSDSVSFQTDLYSYGVLLYEIATGSNPFVNVPITKMVSIIEKGEMPVLSSRYGNISRIYDMCTSLDIEMRGESFYVLRVMTDFQCYFKNTNVLEIKELIDKYKSVKYENRKDIQFLIDFASNGNSVCQFLLGMIYMSGYGVEKDKEKSLEWYKMAAEQNQPDALCNLGLYYFNEVKDLKKAKSFFIRGANLQHVKSIVNLAALYQKKGKLEKAFTLFLNAADQGNVTAQRNVGLCYFKGTGVNPSHEKAFKYTEMASENGDSRSLYQLGCFYSKGIGISINLEKAFKLYKKASNLNNFRAQFSLANCYLKGIGTQKDISKAIFWFKKSSKEGELAQSMYSLGKIYSGPNDYEHKNYTKAIKWFRKALEKGVNVSLLALEMIYKDKNSEYTNPQKALDLLNEFNSSPNTKKKLQINEMMDLILNNSLTLESVEKTMHIFLECNSCFSNMNLAMIYHLDLYQNKDIDKAIHHYKMAHEKGDRDICLFLAAYLSNDLNLMKNAADNYGIPAALLYMGEHLMATNEDEAIKYLEKAVQSNVYRANYLLGIIKEKNNCIDEAIKFYSQAAAVYQDAEEKLKNLSPNTQFEKMFSKCSFHNTKESYAMQHCFMCLTCNLFGIKCICGYCVDNCHKGHKIIDNGKSIYMFCDCQCSK